MASSSVESVVETHTPVESPQSITLIPQPYNEQPPPKLKGRQRLLAGLQRISSSQSVNRLGSSRSRTYSGNGKASISCISLQSAQSLNTPALGSSLTQELALGYSTAPTSAVTTPGAQAPFIDERARLRYLSLADGKTSAGMPADLRSTTKSGLSSGITKVDEDYFSRPVSKPVHTRGDLNFWRDLPSELKMEVLTYLQPREVIRCSVVSKAWHKMCFDGQLWAILDTADFYQDIPADALVKVITSAGPFVRDLNLRGCVQLRERWHAKGLSDACTNLENISLEGCRIDRTSIHNFLWSNSRLVHINVSGLAGATNSAMKILATNCPKLEHLNVSWCNNIDTRGLKKVIEACPNLKDLRAGEVRGWDDLEVMQLLFECNALERLIMMNCDTLTDESLAVLIEGNDSEVDYLSGRPVVQPRRLKHLDLTRCRGISDTGLRSLVGNVPELEGLQLSKVPGIFDATLTELLPTTPLLSHLDLEEHEGLTNAVLQCLASAPCAKRLRHLSISYCENMGDSGMIPLLKTCTNLRNLEMDNTRISDLVLTEAAAMIRQRAPRTLIQGKAASEYKPPTGLRLVAYDCQNVTWTGVREVLSRNAEVFPRPDSPPRIHITRTSSFPSEIIQLKCFYTYQPTVEEHTKRVLRGDFAAARRLERKWAEFMIAQEEAGAAGAGSRRRRRRAREAQMMHADEADDGVGPANGPLGAGTGVGVGGGRRRRARSGGCAVM
ncbi:hypothetical protein BAUCODRAFT_62331 [Baudoinia panamericana UAMH 10762]|uniref:F-box domain-containing protein n=1 Tax=Baudoinia panamericana (strain UAMH 10762) TaxID=717646 RepID=M2N950_BAUPA|nr:uncharacterized protein BAUCODRAFT_62331 [Baudoinia panamericana UAMH 10762]EMD00689.1 hypothetical protein BAUCODRAFT_62331 [Baudoinia panamericana UAMH 10762]